MHPQTIAGRVTAASGLPHTRHLHPTRTHRNAMTKQRSRKQQKAKAGASSTAPAAAAAAVAVAVAAPESTLSMPAEVADVFAAAPDTRKQDASGSATEPLKQQGPPGAQGPPLAAATDRDAALAEHQDTLPAVMPSLPAADAVKVGASFIDDSTLVLSSEDEAARAPAAAAPSTTSAAQAAQAAAASTTTASSSSGGTHAAAPDSSSAGAEAQAATNVRSQSDAAPEVASSSDTAPAARHREGSDDAPPDHAAQSLLQAEAGAEAGTASPQAAPSAEAPEVAAAALAESSQSPLPLPPAETGHGDAASEADATLLQGLIDDGSAHASATDAAATAPNADSVVTALATSAEAEADSAAGAPQAQLASSSSAEEEKAVDTQRREGPAAPPAISVEAEADGGGAAAPQAEGGASELSSAQEEDGPGTPRHEAGERLPGTPAAAAAALPEASAPLQAPLQPAAPPAATAKAPPTLSPEQQLRYQQEAEATVAAIAGAAAAVKPFPSELLPAVGTSNQLEGQHLDVLAAWFTLYSPDTDAQQLVAMQHFRADSRFEDNFVLVTGSAALSCQFYAMWRLLRSIQLLPEKIEVRLPADSTREHHTTTSSTSAASSSGSNSVSALLSSIVPTSLAGLLHPGGNGAPPAGTYQLRIVVRIACELWIWKQLPLLVLLFLWPLLLLLPRVVEVWCTDVLTVSNATNRVVSYKQRVHNIPTAPWPLRWLLGMAVSRLMHGCGW